MIYYFNRYWGLFYTNSSVPGELSILDENSKLVGPGYSGHYPHVNSPGAQNLRNLGPLPSGWYTLKGPVSKNNSGIEVGPNSFHLIPDVTTKMFGRSGMMIHGDNEEEAHTASDGCIIVLYWVRIIFKNDDRLLVL